MSFFVIVGFVTYLASSFLLALIPPVGRCLFGIGGLVCAIPMMLLGVLVAVLLARRFQTISVILMASVVLVVGGTFVGFEVFQVVSGPSEESIAAAAQHEDLLSELDRVVSMVSTPAGWEVKMIDNRNGGLAYRVSSDLSRGTWMLISVAPFAMSEEGESPEDSFWRFVERVAAEGSAEFVQEPIATSASGLNGYWYELSGFAGETTGQELGGYLAIFFGPEYTYEVFVQFELSDQDDMLVLFQDTLAGLTLTSNDEAN